VDHPFHQYLTGIQHDNTVKENSEKSRMGKHKQVACQICFNFMRSDHMKGHMEVHQKYSPTNETPQSAEDICRDLVLEIVGKVVAPVEETPELNENIKKLNARRKLQLMKKHWRYLH